MEFDAAGPQGEIRIAYKPIVQFGAWSLSKGVLTSEAVATVDPIGIELGGARTVSLTAGAHQWVFRDVVVDSYQPVRVTLTGRMQTTTA